MRSRELIVAGALAVLIAIVGLALQARGPEARTPEPLVAETPFAAVRQPTRTRAPERTQTSRPGREALNISLVGSLRLAGDATHADVAAYKHLAFVGLWGSPCTGAGVDIIDIQDPSAPRKLADTEDYTNTSMEDVEAMEIGGRDVLAIGLQECSDSDEPRREGHAAPPAGQEGLELVDISDPENPISLSIFETGQGVHELDLTRNPAGQSLALLAVLGLEEQSLRQTGLGGTGDLLIVDVSNPAAPQLLSEWGVLGDQSLGEEVFYGAQQGNYPDSFLHSVRASADGTRAYLSYWDAGVIILDISNPARPRVLGRTSFGPGEEGNAHSVDESAEGTLLVETSEEMYPFDTVIESAVLEGRQSIGELGLGTWLSDLPDERLEGLALPAGAGCMAELLPPEALGEIVLVEAGGCGIGLKALLAEQAGAAGLIVYARDPLRPLPGREDFADIDELGRVETPDGDTQALTIPVFYLRRQHGLALAQAGAPARVLISEAYGGFGSLRLFDIADPAQPRQLGHFATRRSRDQGSARSGTWTSHNVEIEGDLMYVSWYHDGVRVVDISDPTAPREVGFWTGLGMPNSLERPQIWGVAYHDGLLLASDMGSGLYILKYTPE